MAHSEQHHQPKKAYFISPMIMGLSFWLFAFFFLSLCDGPAHGHDAESTHSEKSHEQIAKPEESKKVENKNEIEADLIAKDSIVQDTAKAAEAVKDSLK